MKKTLLMATLVSALLFSSCTPNSSNSDVDPISPSVTTYNVSFDSNGGTLIDSQTVVEGHKIIKPINPSKNGYTFVEWTYNNTAWDFNDSVTSDMTLLASWVCKEYTITYELDGGVNHIDNPSTYTVEVEFTLQNPSKDGYTFTGWTLNDEKITSIELGTTGDLTLVANWDANPYDVVVTSSNAIQGSVIGSGSYECDTVVTVNANPNRGYKFKSWYEGITSVSEESSYSFNIPSHNVELIAFFELEIYNITYELEGGELPEGATNPSTYTIEDSLILAEPTKFHNEFKGWMVNSDSENIINHIEVGTSGHIVLTAIWAQAYIVMIDNDNTRGSITGDGAYYGGDEVTINATPNNGYGFNGWYEGTTLISSDNPYTFTMPNNDVSYRVRWYIITYKITYKLNGGKNHDDNPTTYTIEKDLIELYEPSKDGYTFNGWWNIEAQKYVTYIPAKSFGDLTLEARWTKIENNVHVFSSDYKFGSVAGDGMFAIGDEVTVTAHALTGGSFKGWYNEDTKVSNDATYTFILEREKINLQAIFWSNEKENEYYAKTPTLSSDGKTATYGLYPKTVVLDAVITIQLDQIYQSLEPETNGWYSYKGIYYAKEKAKPMTDTKQFDDGTTTIVTGTEYWFKCEPITWNVIGESSGVYKLISRDIITANRFDSSSREYKKSSLRTWLNNDFLSSAFVFGAYYIQTQTDVYSDNISLLSKEDMEDNENLKTNTQRVSFTTDYARALGSYSGEDTVYLRHGWYWTRSPFYIYTHEVDAVNYSGDFGSSSYSNDSIGVRPTINIKLP